MIINVVEILYFNFSCFAVAQQRQPRSVLIFSIFFLCDRFPISMAFYNKCIGLKSSDIMVRAIPNMHSSIFILRISKELKRISVASADVTTFSYIIF